MTQVALDSKVTERALWACYKDKLYLEYGWGMAQVTLNPKVTAGALCACYKEKLCTWSMAGA